MSENHNGEPVHVSKILQEAQKALENSDQRLLESWQETHPALRAVILGATYAGDKWSAGTLSFRRDGHEIVCTLRIDEYGIQAVLRDNDLDPLLETLEYALQNRSVPWDKTFQEKKKDKDRIAAARRGS